jgi:hypothetical protein
MAKRWGNIQINNNLSFFPSFVLVSLGMPVVPDDQKMALISVGSTSAEETPASLSSLN